MKSVGGPNDVIFYCHILYNSVLSIFDVILYYYNYTLKFCIITWRIYVEASYCAIATWNLPQLQLHYYLSLRIMHIVSHFLYVHNLCGPT